MIEGVTIRQATLDDANLVYSSWLASFRGGNRTASKLPSDSYFRLQRETIRKLLECPTTRVDVCECVGVVIAWACHDPVKRLVHYVYVKHAYRRKGIAAELLSDYIGNSTTVSHMTRIGNRLLPDMWDYYPQVTQ